MKLMLAKGTRDFSPEEKIVRDEIMSVLRETCEVFGFSPVETPIFERYETLAAKFAAGENSDCMQETFKLSDQGDRKLGLRYDLTVPFCRYMAMNKAIKKPFKKYMYGEVFRDGPLKKGRYRQFTQFDPDIVGCKSMIADAEILALADMAFRKLGSKFYIDVNNKKILIGVLEDTGIKEKDYASVLISVDKLKKIGVKGVKEELLAKDLVEKQVNKILNSFEKESTNKKTLDKLKKSMKSSIGKEGLKELEEMFNFLKKFGIKSVNFEPALARGLGYYTGTIFEAFLKDSKIKSSVAGGGRYDKMIGDFIGGKEEVPAVGISFGVEVIIESMREKRNFDRKTVAEVYVIPVGIFDNALGVVGELREKGVKTDVDLLNRGLSKNLKYASSYGIPYVLFVGEEEFKKKKFKLRNMKTGSERMLSLSEVVKKVK
jgi:histidyl-tRNA synthetase